MWINRDWSYTTPDTNFGDDGKATQCSLPDNLT